MKHINLELIKINVIKFFFLYLLNSLNLSFSSLLFSYLSILLKKYKEFL